MKHLFSLIILAGLWLLSACQGPNVSLAAPGPTTAPSSTNAPAETPIDHAATPVAEPSIGQTDTPVAEPSKGQTATPDADTPISNVENMVQLSVDKLSQQLNINADQIVVMKVNPVIWRDASLGCPKPGIDYARVETPGYNITLQAGGKVYNYHTNETNRAVLCNQ
jgi:hypothetical protein